MSFALFPSHFHILQTHASVQSNPSSITQKRYGEKHKDMKFRHLQQITWTWDKNQDHFQLHNHDTAPLHIRGMSILACLGNISGIWGYLYLDNRPTPVHPTEKLGLKWVHPPTTSEGRVNESWFDGSVADDFAALLLLDPCKRC